MVKIKKGDFVEMDFTGKVSDTGQIFDTTSEELAKKNNIHQSQARYIPVVLVVGEMHVVKGLDTALVGMEPGKHSIHVSHEDAFGKKVANLLKIIPMKDFKKQGLKPFVGMEVNVDNLPGIVRSLSGGRIIVDFNHPLSSKDLDYDIDIKRIITEDKDRVESMLTMMSLPYDDLKVEGKKATITYSMKLPTQMIEQAGKEIERLAGVKVDFKEKSKDAGKEEK